LSQYIDRLRVGRPGFDSLQGQDIFLYLTASRPAVESPHSPIKWGGHEADHSPPCSGEENNGKDIPPFPHVFMEQHLSTGQLYVLKCKPIHSKVKNVLT
jgi:hypothetical protein